MTCDWFHGTDFVTSTYFTKEDHQIQVHQSAVDFERVEAMRDKARAYFANLNADERYWK